MANTFSRLALAFALLATTSACALGLRNPHIDDLRNNPGRYQNRTVYVDGTVTSSWGVPMVPFRLYKVDETYREVTVISQGTRTPTRGAHVRVKGKVNEVAVFVARRSACTSERNT